jgi:hypothetical protein
MTLLSATEVAVSTDEHGETGKGQKKIKMESQKQPL